MKTYTVNTKDTTATYTAAELTLNDTLSVKNGEFIKSTDLGKPAFNVYNQIVENALVDSVRYIKALMANRIALVDEKYTDSLRDSMCELFSAFLGDEAYVSKDMAKSFAEHAYRTTKNGFMNASLESFRHFAERYMDSMRQNGELKTWEEVKAEKKAAQKAYRQKKAAEKKAAIESKINA